MEAEGEERLVIVQEVERRRRMDAEEVAEAVRRAVAEEHEVQVHEVVLIRAGSLPKTSSGKVQRRLCRKLYLAGELKVVGRSALAAADPAPEIGIALDRGGLAALDPAERRPMLQAWLRERAAAILGVPASRIGDRQPLTGLGLDSLSAVELKASVEGELGLPVPLSELLRGVGIAELADDLLSGLAEEPAWDVPLPRALSLAGGSAPLAGAAGALVPGAAGPRGRGLQRGGGGAGAGGVGCRGPGAGAEGPDGPARGAAHGVSGGRRRAGAAGAAGRRRWTSKGWMRSGNWPPKRGGLSISKEVRR